MVIYNLLVLIAGIVVLVILSYRGISIYVSALVGSLVIIVFTPAIGIFEGLKAFETGTAGFVQGYLIYMLLAVMMGEVMNITGTATVIGLAIVKLSRGRAVILTVLIVGAAITTCGISGYVAAYATFPILIQVFKSAKIPRELIPGLLNGGQLLGCGLLPYNTLTNNTIPTEFLGSSIAGEPLFRLTGWVFATVLAWLYFTYAEKRIRRKMTEEEIMEQYHLYDDEIIDSNLPSLATSLIPVVCGFTFLIVMTNIGVWKTMPNVYTTVSIIILLTAVMNFSRIKDKLISTFQSSFKSSISSLMTCGIVIGFGSVIAMSPFFQDVVTWLETIDMNPYFQSAIITSVLAGITASAPGGIRMTLQIFGERWVATGCNVNALHAITTCAGLGLNTMPHNGTVIVCNQRSRMPIKGTFFHTFMVGGLIITLASLFEALLATFLWPV